MAIISFNDLPAQIHSYSSFLIDGEQVVWAKVFEEPDMTADKLKHKINAQLSQDPSISNIVVSHDTTLTATIENFYVDYKRFNISRLTVPSLVSSAKWFGTLKVDFKDGRYRVVIYNLKYYVYHDEPLYGKRSPLLARQSGNLTDEVLNRHKDRFKKTQANLLNILHASFLDNFSLQRLDAQLPKIAYSQDW